MPPFDSRTWMQAHEPPVFISTGGATYTGRLWSHLEYVKWVNVFKGWLGRAPEDYEVELRALIGSMGFAADAVEQIVALPNGALEELLDGFFVLQKAGKNRPPHLTPATPAPSTPTGPASQSSAS